MLELSTVQNKQEHILRLKKRNSLQRHTNDGEGEWRHRPRMRHDPTNANKADRIASATPGARIYLQCDRCGRNTCATLCASPAAFMCSQHRY